MPVPELPPEAYILSTEEVAELTQFSNYKTLGGLLLSLVETTPAAGFDPSYGPEGLRIPADSTDHIIMHIDYINGPQQLRHDIVRAATYMQLQPIYREYKGIVGVTYRQLANVAVRAFGCHALKPKQLDPMFRLRLSEVYESLPIAQKAELEPVMLFMDTEEFIGRFGAKYVGTNARELAGKIANGEPLVHNRELYPDVQDPILRAINATIATMEDHQ
jgi:hypothetical protein